MLNVGIEAEVLRRLAEHAFQGEQIAGVRSARFAGLPPLHHARRAAVGVRTGLESGLADTAGEFMLADVSLDPCFTECDVGHGPTVAF